MMTRMTDDLAFDDLKISKPKAREAGGGSWVEGTVRGYKFSALVFPTHADDPSYELGQSRISKLWVQRIADQKTVFNFDRGQDVPADGARAQLVVDFLAAGLAEHVYGA